MEARVAAARANLETRRRAAANSFAAAQIAAGADRLPAALEARWVDAATRRAWVDDAVGQARALLPRDERDALATDLASTHGTTVTFVEDATVGAGLKLAAAGNVVDGTRAGLLADRAEIGALLLAALEAR